MDLSRLVGMNVIVSESCNLSIESFKSQINQIHAILLNLFKDEGGIIVPR